MSQFHKSESGIDKWDPIDLTAEVLCKVFTPIMPIFDTEKVTAIKTPIGAVKKYLSVKSLPILPLVLRSVKGSGKGSGRGEEIKIMSIYLQTM